MQNSKIFCFFASEPASCPRASASLWSVLDATSAAKLTPNNTKGTAERIYSVRWHLRMIIFLEINVHTSVGIFKCLYAITRLSVYFIGFIRSIVPTLVVSNCKKDHDLAHVVKRPY